MRNGAMKANVYPGRLEQPDWNNIECLSQNRMPAHAYLVQFPDLSSCMHATAGNQRHVSPYVFLLNGQWNFIFYPSVTRLPENSLSLRSGFQRCTVPSCWQMNGHDRIIDQSKAYPFPVNPPRIPDDVPVGVFRRVVRLPLVLGGLRKRIVFQGVSSAFHLFINGKLAGYSEGGFLPVEFDITGLMHDGDNELFVLVYGFCATSYLNGHELPVLNGIFRDVYIEAVPAVSVFDLSIRTSRQDEGGSWRLELDASLISFRISTESPILHVLLMDQEEILYEAESRITLTPCAGDWGASPVQAKATAVMTTDLTGIRPWTAETPELYQLYLSVSDRQGRELSCIQQAIGFREVSLAGNQLSVNGQPVRLFPIRLQGFHPRKGTALSMEDWISDIRLMKRSNVNAVLTERMPPDPIFLELCDIYGLYVVSEMAVAFPQDQQDQSIQDDPLFLPAFLERTERLVALERNHSSVLCWSMAGQGICGMNHEAMKRRAHYLDPTRPSLTALPAFAGRGEDRWSEAALKHPWHDLVVQVGDPADPRFVLAATADNSQPTVSRCVFMAEGLVDADQQPHLALMELAQLYQPILMEAVDAANGAFVLVNRRCFTHTGDLTARFLVLHDGLEVLTGELDALRIEPGGRRFIEIPYGDLHFDDGSEYILRVEYEQTDPNLHAQAGHCVGFHEFRLSDAPNAQLPGRSMSVSTRLRMERDRHLTIISGHRFYLVFNHLNGTFDACRFGEKELFCGLMPLSASGRPDLAAGPRVHVYRAPSPADLKTNLPRWKALGYDRLHHQVESIETACDGQSAVIEVVESLAADGHKPVFQAIIRYEITTNGAMRVFVNFNPLQPDLAPPPRLGIRFFLRPEYSRATFYGPGPQAGSRTRRRSQRTGIYRLPVAALHERSLRHQEDDARIDVRYLKLQDEQGFGFLISGDRNFLFSARTFTSEDLARTACGSPLPHRPFIEVILDDEQIGDPVLNQEGKVAAEPSVSGYLDGSRMESRKFAFTLSPIVS